MGKKSTISWTDATWNPWRGCDKVSEGCKNCYMFKGQERWGKDPTIVTRAASATFYAPLKWKDPKMVFTCSWSDWFHWEADSWRKEAWAIIEKTPHLTYQILTKRPDRIKFHLPSGWMSRNVWAAFPHVWIGVSVENRKAANKRIPILQEVPNVTRFLSVEPLLENLAEIDLKGISWVIVGGESGPKARPMDPDWARIIREQCIEQKVGFFMKQMGGVRDKREALESIPEDLRIREFPRQPIFIKEGGVM